MALEMICSTQKSPPVISRYEYLWAVDRYSIFIRAVGGIETPLTVARCGRFFHGVVGHHDSQYGGPRHLLGPSRGSPQHEGGAGELYAESCGLHSNQRLDGGPLWNPSRIRVGHRPVHARFLSMRNIGRHSPARCVSSPARLRRSDDGSSRSAYSGTNIS